MTIILKESDETEIGLITVSKVLRKKFGKYKVKGTIIGISKLFNMISKVNFYCDYCNELVEFGFNVPSFDIPNIKKKCNKCNKPSNNEFNFEFKTAVIVELQDMDIFNEIDRLSVFLFDRDTEGIVVGENVCITGNIEIIYIKKKFYTYFFGESIKYLDRKNVVLTKQDIEAIKRFKSKKGENNVINSLVDLFDKSIVGYEHTKKGILCSTVNTSNKISKSEHLDALLIGEPGLAKTKFLKRASKLVPGSCHESAQHSSGKSITAIVEKSDDNIFLRLGVIPIARGCICCLNELSRMSMEDQAQLLDIMEERELTINKYGIHSKILAPTTIIASANPINKSKWKDSDKIDLNEFPILEPIIDRYDFIFVFRSRENEEEINKFVDKLSEVEDKKDKGKIPDYTTFLIKYIQFSKQFNPILTEEARIMLKEFYKKISIKGFGSPRILITLFKLAKAIARLKLKNIVDEIDAKETMEFYNIMLLDFQKNVIVSQSPKEIAYNESTSLLKDMKDFGGITLEELIEKICQNNKQIGNYFGYGKKSLKIEYNKKVRNLKEMLRSHSNIKRIQDKPIVLQWLSDLSASSDLPGNEKNSNSNLSSNHKSEIKCNKEDDDLNDDEQNNGITTTTKNDNNHDNPVAELENNKTDLKSRSDEADRSDREVKSYKCNYCSSEFTIEREHEKHCVNSHPGIPARPNKKWIKVMKENGENVEFKGNLWE